MNKHADLMDLYLQDWKVMSNPWKLWECKNIGGIWGPLIDHPTWSDQIEYRRSPTKIVNKSIQFPRAEVCPLESGTSYYVPDLLATEAECIRYTWNDDSVDDVLLERGFVHLSQENAIEHAKALLSLYEKR